MHSAPSARRRRLRLAAAAAALVAVGALAGGSAVAATVVSAAESGQPPASPAERLAREFSAALSLRIAPRSTCLTVLLDDELIFEAQGDSALVPASLMKIATAAAAFEILEPDGVYTTEVFARSDALAAASDGTLRGDVYLVGGGDPVLNTPRYGARIPDPVAYTDVTELADRVHEVLASRGIRRIEGRIIGDDSWYPDRVRVYYKEFPPGGDEPVWRYSHDTLNYIGPLSGLLINDGFASYTWKTGIEDRRDYVRATDPTRHAASVLNSLLEVRGTPITRWTRAGAAPAPAELTLLASIESPPISAIVARMLSRSDNTIAEMMLKEIGRQTLGSSREVAVAVVHGVLQRLLGPLAAGIEVADGSGVSRYNRLTCAAVAELLRQAGPGSPLVEGLSLAGETGTLKACRPAPPAAGQGSPNPVLAKTGTVYLSNSLAGVTVAANGEAVTFAMMANGHNMGLLGSCNALRRTLLNAAAQYTYGPVPWGSAFDAVF